MKVIGITGGVGAGKSEILKYLKEKHGAVVIEADKVGHLLMEPGKACYYSILEKCRRNSVFSTEFTEESRK